MTNFMKVPPTILSKNSLPSILLGRYQSLVIFVFVGFVIGFLAHLAPSLTVLLTVLILFGIITLQNRIYAVLFLLGSLPFTRYGLCIQVEYFNIHLIYLLQLIFIIRWMVSKLFSGIRSSAGNIIIKPLAIFFCAAIASTLYNGISGHGIRELMQLSLNLMMVYVLIDVLVSGKSPVWLVRLWVGLVTLYALSGLIMSFLMSAPPVSLTIIFDEGNLHTIINESQSFIYGIEIMRDYRRVEFGFGAPYASFPAMIMVGLLIGISIYLVHNRPNRKRFYWSYINLSIIILFIILIFTFTRSAWCGFIFGILILILVERISIRWLLLFLFGIIAILLVPNIVHSRFSDIFIGEEPARLGRILLLEAGWKLIMNYPIFGVGFGGVGEHLAQMSNITGQGELHSAMGQLWTELGTVGLLSFLLILVMAVRITAAAVKDRTMTVEKAVAKGLLASMFALVIQGIFVPGLDQLFWYSLGILIAIDKHLFYSRTYNR